MSETDNIWAKYVAKRDKKLRERLIIQYAPLVKYVVGRFPVNKPSILTEEDLLSHGIVGLIQAVERFDPTRGVKFETYAIPRIRGAIIDGLRTLDMAGRSTWRKAKELERTLMRLEKELDRHPTDEEVAQAMGLNIAKFQQLLCETGIVTISLDTLFSFDDSGEQTSRLVIIENTDSANPELEAEKSEIRDTLREALRRLPERERLLLALYYHA